MARERVARRKSEREKLTFHCRWLTVSYAYVCGVAWEAGREKGGAGEKKRDRDRESWLWSGKDKHEIQLAEFARSVLVILCGRGDGRVFSREDEKECGGEGVYILFLS
jgi:hypothetical protein